MPVSQDSSLTLQAILLYGSPNKNVFENLHMFVEQKPTVAQNCTPACMGMLQRLMKQTLECTRLTNEDLLRAEILLQVVQLVASYEDHAAGLPVLMDSGLMDMIEDAFLASLHCVKDGKNTMGDKFYDDVMETMSTVAEYDIGVKSALVEVFCMRFLQILTALHFRFSIRMEALRTLNSLLERCPFEVKENLKEHIAHKELIQRAGSLISTVGDYEMQVGLTEALFRLTHKGDRVEYAKAWFEDEVFLHAFLYIRDSDFETDCRQFLNVVNGCHSNKFRVFSLPCYSVVLGKFELQKPCDVSYTDFWVDFNTGSKRITLFCNQESESQESEEESMWETVTIWDENVISYDAKDEAESDVKVLLQLNVASKTLIGFGPDFCEQSVTMIFDRKFDVKTALEKTFGKVKSLAERKTKVSAAEYPVHINRWENMPQIPPTIAEEAGELGHIPNQRFPVEQAHGSMYRCSQESVRSTARQSQHTAEANSTPRMKVSVPAQPMRTPTRMCPPLGLGKDVTQPMMAGSSMAYKTAVPVAATVQQSAKRTKHAERSKDMAVPKTPVGRTTRSSKRVKTPLQMVMGDDQSEVSTGPPSTSRLQQVKVSVARMSRAQEDPLADTMQPNAESSCISTHQQKENEPSRRAVKVQQFYGKDTVIPSSVPEEQMVVPDSQPIPVLQLPALSAKKKSPPAKSTKSRTRKCGDDSGVCLDLTSEPEKLSNADEGTAADLRDEVESIDYTSYLKNTMRVSTTPSLSTVSEESSPRSTKTAASQDHTKSALAPIQETEEIPVATNIDDERLSRPEKKISKTSRRKPVNSPPQPIHMSPDSTSQTEPPKRGKATRHRAQKGQECSSQEGSQRGRGRKANNQETLDAPRSRRTRQNQREETASKPDMSPGASPASKAREQTEHEKDHQQPMDKEDRVSIQEAAKKSRRSKKCNKETVEDTMDINQDSGDHEDSQQFTKKKRSRAKGKVPTKAKPIKAKISPLPDEEIELVIEDSQVIQPELCRSVTPKRTLQALSFSSRSLKELDSNSRGRNKSAGEKQCARNRGKENIPPMDQDQNEEDPFDFDTDLDDQDALNPSKTNYIKQRREARSLSSSRGEPSVSDKEKQSSHEARSVSCSRVDSLDRSLNSSQGLNQSQIRPKFFLARARERELQREKEQNSRNLFMSPESRITYEFHSDEEDTTDKNTKAAAQKKSNKTKNNKKLNQTKKDTNSKPQTAKTSAKQSKSKKLANDVPKNSKAREEKKRNIESETDQSDKDRKKTKCKSQHQVNKLSTLAKIQEKILNASGRAGSVSFGFDMEQEQHSNAHQQLSRKKKKVPTATLR